MGFRLTGVHIVVNIAMSCRSLAQVAADAALMLPSLAETFSTSELRSFGIPVIATRLGALAERIRDGVVVSWSPDAARPAWPQACMRIQPRSCAPARAWRGSRCAPCRTWRRLMLCCRKVRPGARYRITDMDAGASWRRRAAQLGQNAREVVALKADSKPDRPNWNAAPVGIRFGQAAHASRF